MHKHLITQVQHAPMSSLCFSISFNSCEEMLPKMVQKIKDLHVFPDLKITTTIFVSFDLKMSKGV